MKTVCRCHVNLEGLRTTKAGKRKVWFTTKVVTHCCTCEPCYFIWERATKYNNYNYYAGYVPVNCVKFLEN